MNKLIASMFASALLLSVAAHADEVKGVSISAPAASKNWFGDGMKDTGVHARPNYLSVQVILGYGDTWGVIGNSYVYGFAPGVAARYDIPLKADGFISSLNDSFDLELGVDARCILGGVYGFNSYGFGVGLDIEAVAEVKYVMYFLS